MKNYIYILIFIIGFPLTGVGQGDVSNEMKPFYSAYLNKKINYRWSADFYSLFAMKSMSQDFWLSQFNFGANYRINRLYTFSFGYGFSLYKYSPWWDNHYPQSPNFLNTVTFHILNVGVERNDNIGKKLKFSNKIVIQQYAPRFEKYQTRIQYNTKISYRKKDLPITLRPFLQGAIYYYLNGVPVSYYDENLNLVEVASPNGFHRYRIRLGTSFKPVKKNQNLSFSLYLAWNREFNISGLGNDINVPRPSRTGTRIYTSYQFNNYNILGTQVNYFF